MIDISHYDYVVLDCDGVILDSNWLKTDAIIHVLEAEPKDCIDNMITYHKANGGISRYKKFRHYFKEINPNKDWELKAELLISNFARIVKKRMLKCDYIPGVLDFINDVKKRGLPLFIVSGSDEEELIELFNKRYINSIFSAIYGSPSNKIENMKKVKTQVGALKKGIFFGDSMVDMEAAQLFDLDFIFVSGASDWSEGHSIAKKNNYHTIQDFQL